MATISGSVIFNRNRSAAVSSGDPGIANIPVVLQNINTSARLTVLTDNAGNYRFVNVPAGSYRIVEAYGVSGGLPSPGDFSAAAPGDVPQGKNPPISAVANPPAAATNLDAVTPNTLMVAVSTADLTNQSFLNGPVTYTPIQAILDPCAIISGDNRITDADGGTFGSFPQGTEANTGAPTEPYPGVTPDFTYVLPNPAVYAPMGGEYTVQNIMNDAASNEIGAWWRIADHTQGNETGRMMVVNGFNPGAVFFRSQVDVQPETNYLFTAWILNLFKATGYPDPELGVRVLDENGGILYSATLGQLIPVHTDVPEWKQIGSVIQSGPNTRLTVEFLSEGPEVVGNDYAIDDIALREIQVPQFIPIKTVDRPTANVGETVRFTVTLSNTCASPLTSVAFQDTLPGGLRFVPGSVLVNGGASPGADPNAGFALPDIAGGAAATISFDARIEALPSPNPALNVAAMSYAYTPVEGGIPAVFSVLSNQAPVLVGAAADIAIVKTAGSGMAEPGGLLTYTLTVTNAGPSPAEQIVLTDNLPSAVQNATFSLDGGATWSAWSSPYQLGDLPNGQRRIILIRGTVDPSAVGVIENTAAVLSSTPDPNLSNNTDTQTTQVDERADLSVVKLGSPQSAEPGGLVTYTLTVANAGPSVARAAVLSDIVPSELTDAAFSLDNGATFQPWPGTYTIGDLAPGAARLVLVRARIGTSVSGIVTNTATVDSATPDPDRSNNTSTDETDVVPSADLAVTKTGDPAPVPAGGELRYGITVQNNGPGDAQLVTLTDVPPAQLLALEYSTDGGVSYQPWTGSTALGTLPAGAARTIWLRGQVNPSAAGTVVNTASVSSPTPDPNPDNNQDTEITPINTAADLMLAKSGSPDPATPGQTLIYRLDITNFGPNPAVNTVVTDTLPTVLSDAAFSLDGGNQWTAWTGSVNLGVLPSGATQTVLLRGLLDVQATGIIANTASVASDTPDPNPANNEDTALIPVGVSADLSLVKGADAAAVNAGARLSYTLTIANAGPSAAQNVVVNDAVPAQILNPEFSLDGAVYRPWISPYSLGTLAAGEERTITIQGTVDPSAADGTMVNRASVTSDTPDPNTDNNTDEADTLIAASADLSVTKTAGAQAAVPGQIFAYRVTVANNGPSDARDVTLVDVLPASVLEPEFSLDGGATYRPWVSPYRMGVLPAGESRSILIQGMLSASASGSLVNTAVVSSITPDPDLTNNTDGAQTPILPSADISIVKTASPSPVLVGGSLIYVLLVSNAGPSDAKRVVLTDALPAGLEQGEISADGGLSWIPFAGNYTVGDLAPAAALSLWIRATVSSFVTGALVNTALVASDTPDPNPDNNQSTVTTPTVPSADLSMVKRAEPDTVAPGGFITYTLQIANEGPADAQQVVVRDSLPSAVTGATFSVDGGATWRPWNGSYRLGLLAAGAAYTLRLRGSVALAASGWIVNTASVSSDTPDPDPSNNLDTIVTPVSALADLAVEKSASPSPVEAGGTVTYRLQITNGGPADAQNVRIGDRLPEGVEQGAYSLDEGATWMPWDGAYALGSIAAGAGTVILIRGTVTAAPGDTLENTAIVGSDTPDPDPDNNTSTVQTPVTGGSSADLALAKSAAPTPAIPGQRLVYTLVVTNYGPDSVNDATLYDALPPGLDDAEYSVDGGAAWQPWSSPYILGSLAAGQSTAVLIRALVGASAAGILHNTATILSSLPDPNEANNTAAADTPVQSGADLSISKTACPDPAVPCQYLTYRLTVTNGGPADAADVLITDVIPPQLRCPVYSLDGGCSWYSWTGSFALGALGAGCSVTVLIAGIVDPCVPGEIANQASVSSLTFDPDLTNNTAAITVSRC